MTEEVKKPRAPYPRPGAGRQKGKAYPHLQTYPGILWEQRLAYLRMRAQAKYRSEEFTITWEEFLEAWQGKWHMRGSIKGSWGMTRRDWEGPWSKDNTIVELRDEHWKRQRRAQVGRPRGPNKKKTVKNED